MIKAPCKNCPERDYPDCQIMCVPYLEFKRRKEAENEARRKEVKANSDYCIATRRRKR